MCETAMTMNGQEALSPPSTAHLFKQTDSPYLEKLADAPAGFLDDRPTNALPSPHEPVYYFFYGTLKQPEILGRILDVGQPTLRTAQNAATLWISGVSTKRF